MDRLYIDMKIHNAISGNGKVRIQVGDNVAEVVSGVYYVNGKEIKRKSNRDNNRNYYYILDQMKRLMEKHGHIYHNGILYRRVNGVWTSDEKPTKTEDVPRSNRGLLEKAKSWG